MSAPDVAIYLIPLVIFVVLSVIVKARPGRLQRRGPADAHELERIERELGASARGRVEHLLAEGRKIDAIIVVREVTGASLTDAKSLVEQIDATRHRQ